MTPTHCRALAEELEAASLDAYLRGAVEWGRTLLHRADWWRQQAEA